MWYFESEAVIHSTNYPQPFHKQGCGTLIVELRVNGSAPQTLWSLSGEQSNTWNYGSVDLSAAAAYASSAATSPEDAAAAAQPFQVAVIVVRGSNHLGDIAIDDLEALTSKCATMPKSARPSLTVSDKAEMVVVRIVETVVVGMVGLVIF